MRVVVAALLTVAVAVGCDDSGQDYSRSDVQRAFRSQGFELVVPNMPRGFGSTEEALLAPRTGEPFLVLVYGNERDARDAFRTATSHTTFESFDLQEGNVVVTSDEGVTQPVRKRVRDALGQLA